MVHGPNKIGLNTPRRLKSLNEQRAFTLSTNYSCVNITVFTVVSSFVLSFGYLEEKKLLLTFYSISLLVWKCLFGNETTECPNLWFYIWINPVLFPSCLRVCKLTFSITITQKLYHSSNDA